MFRQSRLRTGARASERRTSAFRSRQRVHGSRWGNLLENLESRMLLSALAYSPTQGLLSQSAAVSPYQVPQTYLQAPGGYLTGRSADPAAQVAQDYLIAHAGDLGLNAGDVAQAVVTNQYADRDTGLTHLYFAQQLNGLTIANTSLTVTVTSSGQILNVAGGFVPHLAGQQAPAAPVISAVQAVGAASVLGLPTVVPQVLSAGHAVSGAVVLSSPQLSQDPIDACLQYQAAADGLHLVWNFPLRTPDNAHWYSMNVDATTGQTRETYDWVNHASYNVLPMPLESPNDGSRALQTDPADPAASPFGWHDSNGVAGPEFTDTRGNNVWAQEDTDGNNTGGTRPDGGASLTFDFPLDLALSPSGYQPAAITNLFYWNNLLHDVFYKYGFTEVAGNFQTLNYTGQGLGNDAVQADAQDGTGTNNANFASPPDGTAPRMQMYLFNYTSPNRDGDLDNEIIAHEYGHGVTNRLTGGPANANALTAVQSGGMGEGWSDWFGLMFTQKITDTQSAGYPAGTYVEGQSSTGAGSRRYPYSYDMTKDPLTINNYNTDSSHEVHNTGEILCSTLWDLNWLLINKYGYAANIAQGYSGPGAAGNLLALKLVMDALKIQPANPSFKDARDAILQADQVLTGGANKYEIWTAFARRGMGYSFVDASSAATSVTMATDLPAGVSAPIVLSQAPTGIQGSPVSALDITFSKAMDTSSFSLADDVVSFTGPAGADLKAQITGFSWTNANQTLHLLLNTQSAEGLYTLVLGPQILDTSGIALDQNQNGIGGEAADGFTGTFRYDAVLGQVTATTPANGVLATLPLTTIDFTFNEPFAPASLTAADLTISQGSVVNAVALDAVTARFTLSGVIMEGTLNLSIAAGALTDAAGNPFGVYTGQLGLDAGTSVFPVPLTPRGAPGTLVYDGTLAGNIATPADTDSYSVALDAGQVFSLTVSASGGLQPRVEVRDSQNTLLATADAAGVNGTAWLQTVVAAAAGTCTITVMPVGTSSGNYSVYLLLNAALEAEHYGGPTDDTLATAQNLDGAFVTPGTAGPGSVATVIGKTATAAGIAVAADGFESGSLGLAWSTYSSLATGRIQVSNARTASQGSYGLYLDNNDSSGTNYVLNEAVWNVDLTGLTQATLSFATISYGDESDTLPTNFSGHYNADGVAISSDGTNWSAVWTNATPSAWTTVTVDLAAAATAAGMKLGPNFKIKFQQYDNFNISTDGRGFDAIAVTTPAGQNDFYAVSLKAGEAASFALQHLPGNTPALDLRLSGPGVNGTTLAWSAAGASYDRVISSFVAPADGTYYLQVTGNQTADYALTIGRDLALSMESNNTYTAAQGLLTASSNGSLAALGYISAANAADVFAVRLTAGVPVTFWTSTPADGTGEFVNTLNPRLRLLSPAGAVLTLDNDSAADGRNALLTFTADTSGTYYVEVSAQVAGSVGEYLLSTAGALPAANTFTVASVTPAIGSVLATAATQATFTFSNAILQTTVQPGDLLIDGVPATAVTVSSDRTLVFPLPALGAGPHTLTLADGALSDISGVPLGGFSSAFTLDILPPRVSFSSLQEGDTRAPGSLTISVTFDKAMLQSNLSLTDFSLLGKLRNVAYTPSAYAYGANNSVNFTYLNLPEDAYAFTLLSGDGAFEDSGGHDLDGESNFPIPPNTSGNGVAGGNFVVNFSLDVAGSSAFPALASLAPGSLIYSGLTTGMIGAGTDADVFTINLDAGQLLTVVMHPTNPALRPVISIAGPSSLTLSTAAATAPNQDAVIQTIGVANAGTYTITASSAGLTTGQYNLQLVLNAAVEAEQHNGPSNDTLATAQILDPAFRELPGGGAIASVTGTLAAPATDYYRVFLNAGETLSVMASRLSGTGAPAVALYDGSSNLQALSNTAATNVQAAIDTFRAVSTGPYFVKVTGSSMDYALLLTRNLAFDLEGNDTLAAAQPILFAQSGAQRVLGYLEGGAGGGPQTINFGEIAPAPLNNAVIKGVSFKYQIGGVNSADASIGKSPGPGALTFIAPPVAEGNAAGILTMTLPAPSPTFSFGIALSTPATVTNAVVAQLYNGTTLVSTIPLTTSVHAPYPSSEGLFSYQGVPINKVVLDFKETAASRFLIDNVAFATSPTGGDNYAATLTAGQQVIITTSTPGDGPGAFANGLDPLVELYDSNGVKVTFNDNGGPDGRNALLSYTPADSGVYRIKVGSGSGTSTGEYLLTILNGSAAPAPFSVTAITPSDGKLLVTAPTQATLTFANPIYFPSLQAGDLLLDGTPLASYGISNDRTIVFSLSGGISGGNHTFTLNAGDVLDIHGTPITAFTSGFTLDTTPPVIASSSIQEGDVRTSSALTWTVTFSRPMLASNLDSSDFSLKGNLRNVSYSPATFGYSAGNTVLTLTYNNLPEDAYTATLLSGNGRFEDTNGTDLDGEANFPTPPNPSGNGTAGGNFVVNFSVDAPTAAFPALTGVAPAGSLIYSGTTSGLITPAGDTDRFPLKLEAGQYVTLVAHPTSAALQPTITLLDPGAGVIGSSTAATSGSEALLQTLVAASTGTYTIVVSAAAGAGAYTVQATLNSAVEAEEHGGAADDTLASAQSLDTVFTSFPDAITRAAVLGTANSADYYAVTLAAGQPLSAVLTRLGTGSGTLGLYDAASNLLASGSTTATNVNSAIEGYIATAAGTYYLRVSGTAGDYSLVVTRSAGFDLEPNDTLGASQNLTGRLGVLGSVASTPALNTDYYTLSVDAGQVISLRTFTPGDGNGGYNNLLDPALELYDPAAALVGSNDNSAPDGRNALLSYTALQSGNYVIRVRPSAAGSTSGEYLLDAQAAFANGSPSSPDLLATSDTGVSATDNLTNLNNSANKTLQFQIRSTFSGATVTLYADGVSVGSTTALGTTALITTDGTHALADGLHQFTVRQSQPGQPESPDSPALAVSIQTATPNAPAAPGLQSLSDSGISSADGITNITTPTFDVTAAPYFRAYRNGVLISNGYQTGPTYLAGTQSDGAWAYTLTAVDAAGNESSPSAPASVTIDTVAPAAPAAPDLQSTSDSGVINTDNITNITSPTFDITSAPPYRLYRNGTQVTGDYQTGSTVTSAALSDGTYTFAVSAVDAAGNVSPQSTLAVTIDTVTWIPPGPSGVLDPTFNGTGTVVLPSPGSETMGSIALQSTGKIIAVGSYNASSPQIGSIALARFNADGSLDATFGTAGRVTTTITGIDGAGPVIVLPNDQILVGGFSGLSIGGGGYLGRAALLRYNPDGSLDSTFGSGGMAIFTNGNTQFRGIADIARQSDGKIVAVGEGFSDAGSTFIVARYNSNGSFDSTFNGTGVVALDMSATTDITTSVKIQSDGKIVVSGLASNAAGTHWVVGVAHLNTNGTLDTTFGTSGKALIPLGAYDENQHDMALQPDGRILISGKTFGNGFEQAFLMRLTNTGQLDTTFASGVGYLVINGQLPGNNDFRSLNVQSDGRIVAAGFAGNFAIARFLPDGTLDASFGTAGVTLTSVVPSVCSISDALITPQNALLVGGVAWSGDTEATSDFALGRYTLAAPPPAPDLTDASDSGISSTDNLTNISTPAFTLPTPTGYYARLYRNNLPISSYISGTTFTASLQTDGTSAYTLTILDAAGNESLPSLPLNVTVLTTKPQSPAPLVLQTTSDSGVSNSDGITNITSPTFNISAAPYFRIYRNGTLISGDFMTGSTFTAPAQIDGSLAFTVTAVDSIGNESAPSAPLTITLDTVAPTTPLAPDLQAASDSGVSNSDNITNITTPVFDITAAPYYRVYRGATQLSGDYQTASTFTSAALTDGTYTFGVAAVDAAGNVSAQSTLTVTIDTAAWTPSGTVGVLDPTFNGTGTVIAPWPGEDSLGSIALQSTGKIVAVGSYNTLYFQPGAIGLARFNGDGSLDATFGTSGRVTTVISGIDGAGPVIMLPNDQFLVGGFSGLDIGGGYLGRAALLRYNANGSLDATFGTGGMTLYTNGATQFRGIADMARQTDGKIVAVGEGYSGDSSVFIVARYNANGSFDTTFNGTGLVGIDMSAFGDIPTSLEIQSDGKIVVSGLAADATGTRWVIGVARLNTNGTLDSTFGTGGKALIPLGNYDENQADMILQADGKILISGMTTSGGFEQGYLMRLTTTGQLDTSFAGGVGYLVMSGQLPGNNEFRSLNIQSDGRIVAAGFAETFAIARFLPNGTLDASFGTAGVTLTNIGPSICSISDALITPQNTLLVGGIAWSSGTETSSDFALARYTLVGLPASPDLTTASDTGVSATDNITNIPTPTFTLPTPSSFDAASSGYFARVYRDNQLISNAYMSGTTFTAGTQTAGTSAYTVTIVDIAGNESMPSLPLYVTVITAAPAPPAAPDLQAASDSGASNTDNITKFTTPTFDIAASPYFRFFRDGSLISGVYQTGSTFTTAAQSDGTYAFTVCAVDAAGNVSAPSAPLFVTIDAAATFALPMLEAASDSSVSASDHIISKTSPIGAASTWQHLPADTKRTFLVVPRPRTSRPAVLRRQLPALHNPNPRVCATSIPLNIRKSGSHGIADRPQAWAVLWRPS